MGFYLFDFLTIVVVVVIVCFCVLIYATYIRLGSQHFYKLSAKFRPSSLKSHPAPKSPVDCNAQELFLGHLGMASFIFLSPVFHVPKHEHHSCGTTVDVALLLIQNK